MGVEEEQVQTGTQSKVVPQKTFVEKALDVAVTAGKVAVAILPVGCSSPNDRPLHYFTMSKDDKTKQLPAEGIPARIAAIDELSWAVKSYSQFLTSMEDGAKQFGNNPNELFRRNPAALTTLHEKIDQLQRAANNASNKPELAGIHGDLSKIILDSSAVRFSLQPESLGRGTWTTSKEVGTGHAQGRLLAKACADLDSKLQNDRQHFDNITAMYSAGRRILPALESLDDALAPSVDANHWNGNAKSLAQTSADLGLAITTLQQLNNRGVSGLGWGEPSSTISQLTEVKNMLDDPSKRNSGWAKPSGYDRDPENTEWDAKYKTAQAYDSLMDIGKRLEQGMDQLAPGRDKDLNSDQQGNYRAPTTFGHHHYWGRTWAYPAESDYHSAGMRGFSYAGTPRASKFSSGGSRSSSFSSGSSRSGGFSSGGGHSGGFGGRGFGAGG